MIRTSVKESLDAQMMRDPWRLRIELGAYEEGVEGILQSSPKSVLRSCTDEEQRMIYRAAYSEGASDAKAFRKR